MTGIAVNDDSDWVNGAAMFKGTRVPVSAFFEFFVQSAESGICDLEEFVRLHPEVSLEEVAAYAESMVQYLNERDEQNDRARTQSLAWLAAGEQLQAKEGRPSVLPNVDLDYDPTGFAGPLVLEELRRHEQMRTDELPHMTYDPAYVAHLAKYHGGVPGKQWFRTRKGNARRLGRLLNFATAENLPPPFQPSWQNPSDDLRLEWSVNSSEAMEWISTGCGAWLVPFGILYVGPHWYRPDRMTLACSDLVCFDYRGPARPRVVAWNNKAAARECARCEDDGRDTWLDLDYSRFTEEVADDFTNFLGMLREREEDV